MGSKNKIANQLLSVMLHERELGQTWIEPFVGGANIIDKVSGPRIGSDNHFYLIELLCSVRDGWIPPTNVSKELYTEIRLNKEKFDPNLVAFVGFACSFGGKWFNGYAHNTANTNYAKQGSECLVKQSVNLQGIKFVCKDYQELEIPKNSFIYCDPPYQNTTSYNCKFNHDEFWIWCRDKTKEGHTVFISEYTAPSDFEVVKSISHSTTLNKNKKDKKIENLYKLKII